MHSKAELRNECDGSFNLRGFGNLGGLGCPSFLLEGKPKAFTTLAFASHELGTINFPSGYIETSNSEKPLGVEIAFVTEAVPEAHNQALKAGATELKAPEMKSWGQTVSYVRCPDGTLIEICSFINMVA